MDNQHQQQHASYPSNKSRQENVKGLHREELQAYIRTHYTAPRMVVAGAGAVEHGQLVELSQKYFGQLPLQAPPGVDTGMDPAVFVGSDKRVRVRASLSVLGVGLHRSAVSHAMPPSVARSVPLLLPDPSHHHHTNPLTTPTGGRVQSAEETEAHVALAFRGAAWTSEFAFPLMVLQTILGCWDRASGRSNITSRLGQDVAERELCHSYVTFNTCYKVGGWVVGCGLWVTDVGDDGGKVLPFHVD